MTDEEKELEALLLIDQTSNQRYRQSVRARCGTVEADGKLVPLAEWQQTNELYRPAGRTAPTVTLVCGGAKGCKEGIYPDRSPQNRHLHEGRPEAPHCGCYHNLKEAYGEANLPACTEAYAGNPITTGNNGF